MKSRLNLTVDNELLLLIKALAQKKQTSVSELVENYFKAIVKPAKRKNIISLVEDLPPSNINDEDNLKDLFYQSQAKKNGF